MTPSDFEEEGMPEFESDMNLDELEINYVYY